MSFFVAVTDSPAGDDLSIERSALRGMRVEKVRYQDETGMLDALADADAVMCMHARMSARILGGLRRCRIIARYGTGLDNIDLAAAGILNIPVEGVHDYCSEEVATHTLALILAWNRKLLAYHDFVLSGRWNERSQTTGNWGCGPVTRLSDLTLGLVGCGHIGRRVAQRALACGLRVCCHDIVPVDIAGVECLGLAETLGRADFLSLHLPLSPDTHHFLDAEKIRLMKPGAVLLNTARGALVDETALVGALRSGHLGGALLDVYEKAPLPPEHPLRSLANVLLTPHVAFYSEGALNVLRRRAAESVKRHLGGD